MAVLKLTHTMTKHILIVEDDLDLSEGLKELLGDEGFMVTVANDGPRGLTLAEEHTPDLVILDLNLPTLDGASVCKKLKEHFPSLPVIILTAKNTTQDMVKSLTEIGADDYVAKPFEIDALLARVKARLRSNNQEEAVMSIGDLVLNDENKTVVRGEKPIELTPQEYNLLRFLIMHKNKVLDRDTILNRIWMYDPDIESRVVDVYIGYLRKKIDSGQKVKLIHTVRGFGYTIKEP